MQGLVIGGVVAFLGAVFAWGGTVRSHHIVYRTLSYRSRVWFGHRHHRIDQVAGGVVLVAGLLVATGIVPVG